MEAELQRLRLQVDTTARFWRKGQWFLLGVASLIIVLACVRGIWFLVAIGALMFAGFFAMTATPSGGPTCGACTLCGTGLGWTQ